MKSTSVCVIGAGGMGKKHIASLSRFGITRISCVDPDKSKLNAIKANATDISCYTNLEKIQLEDIDSFVVATPVNTRMELVKYIGSLQKPIFFEKPFALDIENAIELKEYIADASKCVVGFPRRMSKKLHLLKNAIDQLDKPYVYQSVFAQDFKKYRPDFAQTYYASNSTGGGFLNDGLSHHIDLAMFLNDAPLNNINIMHGNMNLETTEVDDFAHMSFDIGSKSRGFVSGNQFQKPNDDKVTVISAAGTFYFDRIKDTLTFQDNDTHERVISSGGENWELLLDRQIECFLQLVGHNLLDENLCTINQAIECLKIIDCKQSN